MRMPRLVPAALLGVALLSACGGPTDPGPGDTTVSVSPSSPVAEATALTLVLDDGEGQVSTRQLSCEPPSGDHAAPAAACAALAKNAGTALAAVPAGKICTQEFAGPQTAVLRGRYGGKAVLSQFNLRNGCEIARWQALVGLLPPINR